MKNEACVRKWLKSTTKDRLFWVEAARGGTCGLPDAYLVPKDAEAFWLELKMGKLVNCIEVHYSLGVMQRATIRKMLRCGVLVGILVGVKGSDEIWLAQIDEEVLDGVLNWSQKMGMGQAFRLNRRESFCTVQDEFPRFASEFLKKGLYCFR